MHIFTHPNSRIKVWNKSSNVILKSLKVEKKSKAKKFPCHRKFVVCIWVAWKERIVSFKTIRMALPWHFPMTLHWKQYSIFCLSSLIFCCSNIVRWSRYSSIRATHAVRSCTLLFSTKIQIYILPCNRNIKSNAHKLGFTIIFVHFIDYFFGWLFVLSFSYPKC